MPATALEQMILELVNRARLDPAAEAARYGIALNEGVPAGDTISTASKQPLAMNETLLGTARAHSQDMIDRDYFAHDTPEGVDPFQRMTNAGYNFTTAGENIALTTSSIPLTDQNSIALHQFLFVDLNFPGRGHRVNILLGDYQEIGVGQAAGNFQGSNGSALTEDFGVRGNQQFLTGVSYADADHDNFYSIGEGRGSMSVVAGVPSTSTGTAGGYSLAVSSGLQTVTFSGGGLASPINVSVSVAANTNAKVDVIDQGTIATSVSLTDLGGATKIIGLGTFGLTLTGDSGNDTFVGTKGNDTIDGAGGSDTVVFSGNLSAYTRTTLGNGSIQVLGPDGTDTLSNVELLQFADQSVAVGNTNHAPQISFPNGTNVPANPGQILAASSLFSATDADGDTLTYFFQDGTAAANSGHFVLNGTSIAQGAGFHVTGAAQLAQLTFVAGSADDDLSIQLADDKGALSAGAALHVQTNHAPVLTVPGTVTANAGQSLQAASLFSATDADGDTLTYFFQDGSAAANSGHFVLNGTAIAQGAGLHVTGTAQLAQLTFVAGSIDDDLSIQLADDKSALSAGAAVHVHANHAPVLTVSTSTVTANVNQSLQASSLFSATDADGDTLTYFFQDGTSAANSGHFVLNGTALAQGAGLHVTGTAQLAQLSFVAGSIDDDLSMQLADDKGALSAGAAVHVHANHAPVLTVPGTATANAGQSVQAASLFSATDADGDTLTYFFQDGTSAANSGHFVFNGTALAQGAGLHVTGTAQLAQLSFVAGSVDDDLSIQLADDKGALSAAAGFHFHVNQAPVLTVPGTVTAGPNQSLQASSLFSVTDAENDTLTYFFQDGTAAANSGHFVLNGTALAQGAGFHVTGTAQLAQLSFLTGSVDDDLSMQVADDHGALSAGAGFHIMV